MGAFRVIRGAGCSVLVGGFLGAVGGFLGVLGVQFGGVGAIFGGFGVNLVRYGVLERFMQVLADIMWLQELLC